MKTSSLVDEPSQMDSSKRLKDENTESETSSTKGLKLRESAEKAGMKVNLVAECKAMLGLQHC